MFATIKQYALLITIGACLVTGFGSGFFVRDSFCDAAKAKAELRLANDQIRQLKDNIKARDAAALALNEQAEKDRAELEKLNEHFSTSVGVCFTESDVDGVRRLWGK